MFGKYVEVRLNDEISVKVWVSCTPATCEQDLQERAINMLEILVTNKKAEIKSKSPVYIP